MREFLMETMEEAGGVVSDFAGGDVGDCSEIAASNGLIHSELTEMLSLVKRN